MTSPEVPNTFSNTLPKVRNKATFRKFTPYDGKNIIRILREIEDMLLQQSRAIDELQSLQVASREVDSVGKPLDGQRCEIFDGQFIRILQYTSSPVYAKIKHKLGRIPQGAISIMSSASNCKLYVEGDRYLNIDPATEDVITIALFGNIGDDHTFILF